MKQLNPEWINRYVNTTSFLEQPWEMELTRKALAEAWQWAQSTEPELYPFRPRRRDLAPATPAEDEATANPAGGGGNNSDSLQPPPHTPLPIPGD